MLPNVIQDDMKKIEIEFIVIVYNENIFRLHFKETSLVKEALFLNLEFFLFLYYK